MMDKKVVIVNRNIASYKVQSNACVLFTKSSYEAANHLLEMSPSVIEMVGGDGTLSATLNDVLTREAGYLNGKLIQIRPRGSGNDRYKTLTDLKAKIGSAIDVYAGDEKAGDAFRIITDDYLLATVNGKFKRYIFNVGGIGLDSQTLIEYEELRNKNIPSSLKYFGAASKAIYKLNGSRGMVEYSSSFNECGQSEPIMFLFMLGTYFGGGMPVNRRLQENDGLFESLILSRANNLKLYSSLVSISILKKSQYKNQIVNYLQPSDKIVLTVRNSGNYYFESDGELLCDGSKPVEVEHISIEVAGKISYLVD
jgi:diacylglycerol kinase family enzyme